MNERNRYSVGLSNDENRTLLTTEHSLSKRSRSFVRPWISHTEDGDRCHVPRFNERSCLRFRVCSYNVLAQSLLEKNSELYVHCPPEYLQWNYRRSLLLQELLDCNADVICLQEVDEDAFHSWFNPNLKSNGYWSLYKKRTGSQNDGCAVFVRGSTFLLEHSVSVEYQRNCPVLNRDNVGIVVLVRSVTHPTDLCCIATTHLLYNPRAGEIKLAQISLLLAEIHRLIARVDCNCPILICGDFNMKPLCPLYKFLVDSKLDYSHTGAHQVSGYSQKKTNRRIPFPLFPKELGIDNRCMYVRVPTPTNTEGGILHKPAAERICHNLTGEHSTPGISTASQHSSTPLQPTSLDKMQYDTQQLRSSTQPQEPLAHQSGPSIHPQGLVAHQLGSSTHPQGPPAHQSGSSTHTQGPPTHQSGSSAHTQGPPAHQSGSSTHPRGPPAHQSGSSTHTQGPPIHQSGSSIHPQGPPAHQSGSTIHTQGPPAHQSGSSTHPQGPPTHQSGSSTHPRGPPAHQSGSSTCPQGPPAHQSGSSTHTQGPPAHQSRSSTHPQGPPTHQSGSSTHTQGPPAHQSRDGQVITHPFNLFSVYPHYHNYGQHPNSITTYHMHAFEHTDYIFYMSPDSRQGGLGLYLEQRLVLPSNRMFIDSGPMPNIYQPSDHIMLCATFMLQPSKQR